MNTKKLSIFGDSIFKGVQLDGNSKYVVKDELEFNLIASDAGYSMENFSKFGCTVTKAWDYFQKASDKIKADIVLMDFGGNDCDFEWKEIANYPMGVHRPKTEFFSYVETYNNMVDSMLSYGIMPIVATLVPIQGDMYIDYKCKTFGLEHADIMKWLGKIERIERFQQMYSDAVIGLSSTRDVPLFDIRSIFTNSKNPKSMMCQDGIHPNSYGQKAISDSFKSFMKGFLLTA